MSPNRWRVIVKTGPLGIGWSFRLEKGVLLYGPRVLSLLGPRFAWWWRPTHAAAATRGFAIATELERPKGIS
jgi:hypothetical protein